MGRSPAGAQNTFPLTWSGKVSAARLITTMGSSGLFGSKGSSKDAVVTLRQDLQLLEGLEDLVC